MASLRLTEDEPQLPQPAPEGAAILPEATVVRPPPRNRPINELLVCGNAWEMSRCAEHKTCFFWMHFALMLVYNRLELTLRAGLFLLGSKRGCGAEQSANGCKATFWSACRPAGSRTCARRFSGVKLHAFTFDHELDNLNARMKPMLA